MNGSMVVLGALLGAGFSAAVGRWAPRPEVPFGVGLVIAALVYIGFAATGGVPGAISTEVGGALLYSAVALAGARRYPLLLAAGWLAHVGWDIGVHLEPEMRYAPIRYVHLCVGFDLIVAGAVLGRWSPRGPRSPAAAAGPARRGDH